MLSPSVAEVTGLLTQAFNEERRLDEYVKTTRSLRIRELAEDPQWLPAVRSHIEALSKVGAAWEIEEPDVWTLLWHPFIQYATAFSGVGAEARSGSLSTAVDWVELLEEQLVPTLLQAIEKAEAVTSSIGGHLQALRSIQPLLSESIDNGWSELATEEQEMTAIAAELAHFQDRVEELRRSISSAELESDKRIISTSVETFYNIATDSEQPVSFLSMAVTAYTISKSFYELVTKTFEIGKTLEKIGELQLKASAEAQAAAGTKLVLRVLYDLEESFDRITDMVPQIVTMWRHELDKVTSVISALNAGADPSRYSEIMTLGTASANWQEISAFAEMLESPEEQKGPPVVFDPQHPLPSGS